MHGRTLIFMLFLVSGCSLETAPVRSDAGKELSVAARTVAAGDSGGPLHLSSEASRRDAGAAGAAGSGSTTPAGDAGTGLHDAGPLHNADAGTLADSDAGVVNDCGGRAPLSAELGADCVHELRGVCLRGDPHWQCDGADALVCKCP
jgi:hypothetical protein